MLKFAIALIGLALACVIPGGIILVVALGAGLVVFGVLLKKPMTVVGGIVVAVLGLFLVPFVQGSFTLTPAAQIVTQPTGLPPVGGSITPATIAQPVPTPATTFSPAAPLASSSSSSLPVPPPVATGLDLPLPVIVTGQHGPSPRATGPVPTSTPTGGLPDAGGGLDLSAGGLQAAPPTKGR